MISTFDLRKLKDEILLNGRVEGHEVEQLRRVLYTGNTIDRQGVELLFELHRRVQRVTPGFEKFFFQAIKDCILADGAIDAEETAWLRRMLFANGWIDDREKKLLRELRGEVRQASSEFQALCAECLK